MEDKFKEKENEFEKICASLFKQFAKKNKHYGNDYFETDYLPVERWFGIKRKIARLDAYYRQGIESELPDETLKDTWMDLAIYAVMELMIMEDKNGAK